MKPVDIRLVRAVTVQQPNNIPTDDPDRHSAVTTGEAQPFHWALAYSSTLRPSADERRAKDSPCIRLKNRARDAVFRENRTPAERRHVSNMSPRLGPIAVDSRARQ